MDAIRDALAMRNPRFRCVDPSGEHETIIPVEFEVGEPATPTQLEQLRALAGENFADLASLFTAFNGVALHVHGDTAGLVVPPIRALRELNQEWREWLVDIPPEQLHAFQRSGFAFATIAQSGNYFVVHQARAYYSSHDGGDDSVWGEGVEDLIAKALRDPARFLFDAGCYTRYFDGESDDQLIPEEFFHD